MVRLISDIIVNEFEFRLDFDGLDSDISCIEEYKNSNDGCFWMLKAQNYSNNNNNDNIKNNNNQAIGTTALRNLKQFESTAELKRMYMLR